MNTTRFPYESNLSEETVTDTPASPIKVKPETNSRVLSSDDINELREKLISLAEKGEIRHTPAYINKANANTLERIMAKHTQEKTDAVNEYFSETLINKFSEVVR